MEGIETDGRNTTADYALCPWDHNIFQCGDAGWWLSIIAKSMLQAHGQRGGALFDPLTGESMLNTSASAEAAALFSAVHWLGPQDTPTDPLCMANAKLFAQGRCLMHIGGCCFKLLCNQGEHYLCVHACTSPLCVCQCTFGMTWLCAGEAMAWKQAAHRTGQFRGHIGIARLPGSKQVYDKKARILVPCTPAMCPLSEPARSSPRGSSMENSTDQASAPDKGKEEGYVNRVQPVAGVLAGINKHSPPLYQLYAASGLQWLALLYRFMAFVWNTQCYWLRSAEVTMDYLTAPHVGFNANDSARLVPVRSNPILACCLQRCVHQGGRLSSRETTRDDGAPLG